MRGNKKESFSKAQLLTSLLKECEHRNDRGDAALLLYEAIEQKLFPIAMENEGYITPGQIISTVLATTKQFDPALYVKYLARYQGVLSVQELKQHLR
jgi:transcriptional regulator NrdR family protein